MKPEDRPDISGGKRALVEGILRRAQTWGIAAVFSAAGMILGEPAWKLGVSPDAS